MNTVLFLIIGIPLIEIYLFIKIGSQIGAFNTVLLILTTAVAGVAYARYEGFNTLKSGMSQLIKNEIPIYEIILWSNFGVCSITFNIPWVCNRFNWNFISYTNNKTINIGNIYKKKEHKKKENNNYIDGEYEDLNEDDDKKI